jgi:O-antigen/teichoic acid export membrane protein
MDRHIQIDGVKKDSVQYLRLVCGIIVSKISQLRGTGLKAKSARGTMILTVGVFAERGMRLVRNMILARLLAPEDFGMMAVVMAVLVFLEATTNVGVDKSVIHNRRGSDASYLNAVWWFQTVRIAFLVVVGVLFAPIISKFYEKPEMLRVLQATFLSVLFYGLATPPLAVLQKKFRFLKAMLAVQGSSVLATIATIIIACYMRSVWALVAGQVIGGVLLCVLSYVFYPFRPRLNIDRGCFGELMSYSRGMVGLSFLTIVALQTDVFVLAKMVPTVQLGMYTLALALAQQPAAVFDKTIGRVLLPAFAEKQNDSAYLCKTLQKIVCVTYVLGVPVVVLTSVFAGPLLSLVYGVQYRAVAVPFVLLCWSMFFSMQGSVFAQIYLAMGVPHLHRRYVVVLALLIVSLIYPGIALFGLTGAAGVLLLSNCTALCLQIIWVRRVIGFGFRHYVRCWAPMGVPTVAAVGTNKRTSVESPA